MAFAEVLGKLSLPKRTPKLPKRTPFREDYFSLGNIGSGAYGTVDLAVDHAGNRVAVKTFHDANIRPVSPSTLEPTLSNSSEMTKSRLSKATQAYRSLSHPYMANFLDITEDGKLVMEYVEGETLAQRAEAPESMLYQEILTYTGQLLSFLEYAHAEGITMNDIKGSNIVIHKGKVKVIDFDGMHRKGDPYETIIATDAFAAPEVLEGDVPTNKSDIFTVGVLAYKLITGDYPFEFFDDGTGKARKRKRKEVISMEHELATGRSIELIRAIDPLIKRALAEDPDQRPTAKEMREELEVLAAEYKAPITEEVAEKSLLEAAVSTYELARIQENLALLKASDTISIAGSEEREPDTNVAQSDTGIVTEPPTVLIEPKTVVLTEPPTKLMQVEGVSQQKEDKTSRRRFHVPLLHRYRYKGRHAKISV